MTARIHLGLTAAVIMAALAFCAPEQLAATPAPPQPVTMTVPPACLVDAKGDMEDGKTRVTTEMCGISIPDGMELDPSPPWALDVGTTRVTWSGTTSAGILATATQSIIVMDTTPPTLTPPAAATLATTETSVKPTTAAEPVGRSIGIASASDVTTSTADLKISHNAPTSLPIGAHTVTWSVLDNALRKSTATQHVTVRDAGVPTIDSCPPDVRIRQSEPIAKSIVKPVLGTISEDDLHDNYDKKLDVINDADLDDGGTFVGETTITWTATDDAGNSATCEQNVYVMEPSIEMTFPTETLVDGEKFGSSMASSGDLLIVGNPHHSTPTASKSGEVIAYRLSDGAQAYRIQHPTPTANQYFGSALAILPGTSGTTLAVGVPGQNTNKGEVLLYNAATGTKKSATIQNPNTATIKTDSFGASLAAVGKNLLVGAPKYNAVGGNLEAGRAYVFDQSGSHMYTITNPEHTAYDRFGTSLAAEKNGNTKRIYIGSAIHKEMDETTGLTTTTHGVVYIYDVTNTRATSGVPVPSLALSSPGTADTNFGEARIRTDSNGGVYIGEPTITPYATWTGKIWHHSSSGQRQGSMDAPSCCETEFGREFALDDRLIYVGTQEVYTTRQIAAFDSSSRSYLDSFVDTSKPPKGYTVIHFGFGAEVLDDGKVAVAEYLTKGRIGKTRVHVLDLRTLAPTFTPPTTSGAAGSEGSETHSQAQAPLTPAQPTAFLRLADPVLVSTDHALAGKVSLTYNVQIDPFEVDAMDYAMSDATLEIVAADVEGSTVTLTYVDARTGQAPATGATVPEVKLIGGIGYY